ncbi:MAG: hypothetical protein GY749_30690 [Desulfobacteraceae bacterium]|nr:hypothetical protein [Desulfobacteraceae bacterium]
MSYNVTTVRKLLHAAFGDEELKIFCYDHFNAVYEKFTVGQTKGARIQLLISYVEQYGRVDALLDGIKKANPNKYAEFKPPENELSHQIRTWFEILGYCFENYNIQTEKYFEWIINVPARRGYDRVLVRGVEGEAGMLDFNALCQHVDEQKTDEGWLVAVRRIIVCVI